MGQTPPKPYRLGNGKTVTHANPALVWSTNPLEMQDHDAQIVAKLFGDRRTRAGESSTEHCGD